MDYIFKEGLVCYEDELHRRAVTLDKELFIDFAAFDTTLVRQITHRLLSAIILQLYEQPFTDMKLAFAVEYPVP